MLDSLALTLLIKYQTLKKLSHIKANYDNFCQVSNISTDSREFRIDNYKDFNRIMEFEKHVKTIKGLGIGAETDYHRLTRLSDLEMAIDHYTSALELLSTETPSKLKLMKDLACAYELLYKKTRDISAFQKAQVLREGTLM